jgi:hypothetical protein
VFVPWAYQIAPGLGIQERLRQRAKDNASTSAVLEFERRRPQAAESARECQDKAAVCNPAFRLGGVAAAFEALSIVV